MTSVYLNQLRNHTLAICTRICWFVELQIKIKFASIFFRNYFVAMHKTCFITFAKENQKQITASHNKRYTYLVANKDPINPKYDFIFQSTTPIKKVAAL